MEYTRRGFQSTGRKEGYAVKELVPGNGNVTVRHAFKPGDTGRLIYLHGLLYGREYGFDHTFEAYVAEPLARFVLSPSPRERVWLVDQLELLMGSLAIVRYDDRAAQLRWFLLHPCLRGRGLGKKLAAEAVDFSREMGYQSLFLWTVKGLWAAAHIYRSLGFVLTEVKEGRVWGCDLTEERYELALFSSRDRGQEKK